MNSMTGFGLSRAQSSQSSIEISIRAVNGRFFETRFHLPREFFSVEADLKKILQNSISRGTVDIFVTRKLRPGTGGQTLLVNKPLAKEYFNAYKILAKELKLKPQFHLESFARLPEVIISETTTELASDEKKVLISVMGKACLALEKERKREGKEIRADLDKSLSLLEALVEEVQSVREEANENLLQRFEAKIKARLNSVEVDSTRLSQEVVLQLEKADINEELSRLKEHLRNYRALLTTTEPVGKKLDFYTQELLREVNTIGSKSSLSKLTQIVVDAKTLIERLREQVQNVE